MAALNTEEINKLLKEPMVDYDFGDEWDDENVDPDFQIDSNHNTDSEKICDPSESPHSNNNIENEMIKAVEIVENVTNSMRYRQMYFTGKDQKIK